MRDNGEEREQSKPVQAEPASTLPDPALVDRAVALARELQVRATKLQTKEEKWQQEELDRMLQTPEDKVTLVKLTDQAFRCKAADRTAEHLTHILDVQGVPRFFSPMDRTLLRGFKTFGGLLPGVAVPMLKEHMQQETANVVLPAEPEILAGHLKARAQEGVRMNLNLLGEALLGEEEAVHRLEKYLEALQLPEVEVMSVKISTIYSQISALAREHTVRVLCDRLELLYRQAARMEYVRNDGTRAPKFIYLDMEEYRDLALTAQVFMRTLDRPGLAGIEAGIALQAYIPDSARAQREINEWAGRRVAAGGAPVTIRLVKGANMEMERVEAALHDWPQAPFQTKRDTDANFKKMLHEAMRPGNLASVRVGVASHNLFDVAYAVVLAEAAGAGDRVQFEMLEGMANHQRRALFEQSKNLLLYAPACRKEEFLNAIGYLIRRLDENTGPENFLRHTFKLRVDSAEWKQLEDGFRGSFERRISDAPRRTQNRLTEKFSELHPRKAWQEFENEPDTDWSLTQNGEWAERIVARREASIDFIPLVIAGKELKTSRTGQCLDPSRPGVVVTRYALASETEIDDAAACARNDPDGWRSRSVAARGSILAEVANELRRHRGDLMWAALANGGKTLSESDPEVSEAVDFVEFYEASARYFYELPGVRCQPRGVVVVVPPWNFPIAIPCGGMAAALAAGNTVILKPASDTVLVAWELCQCFWRGGVPRTALQFAPCPGSTAGQHLVTHAGVDAVILTGGTATAMRMLEARPDLRLFAETGGKNATIVTTVSDRELAVKHVIHSAFGHSGQKCSATSLLLLEGEIYDDPHFKQMLCDAVESMTVGSAWELSTRVGPLIRPPSGDLETALKTLEPGESWAVMPRRAGDNPNLWSPGVKYGVQPGSYTFSTEFFGPVLGVVRFEKLAEAIDYVEQTGYGLTSGLQSLDERDHEVWKSSMLAGNLYINRGTTGAVVLRQPFGGMGKSSFGPGMKAGGPNYVAQFMVFEDVSSAELPEKAECARHLRIGEYFKERLPGVDEKERLLILKAMATCARWWRDEFSREHDPMRLLGQDNFRRYLPCNEILIRLTARDSIFEAVTRVVAAAVTGAKVKVSYEQGLDSLAYRLLRDCFRKGEDWLDFGEMSDDELTARIESMPAKSLEKIRYASPDRVPAKVRKAGAVSGVYIADEPVLAEGRVELLWHLGAEQSICNEYHRYGNLGGRADEERKGPV